MKAQHELCTFFEELRYRWKFHLPEEERQEVKTYGHRVIDGGAVDYFEPALTIFDGGPRGQRW